MARLQLVIAHGLSELCGGRAWRVLVAMLLLTSAIFTSAGCDSTPLDQVGSDVLGGPPVTGDRSGGSTGADGSFPISPNDDSNACAWCPTDGRPDSFDPIDPVDPDIVNPSGPDALPPSGPDIEPPTSDPVAPRGGYPVGGRTPQWPLKTQRRLYNEMQMVQARMLTSTQANAIALKNSFVSYSSYWLTVPDDQLYFVLPDQRVPRAVDVSASSDGCPVHGTQVFAYGTYPWILDKEHPYTVKCPVGNETYPSNDFSAYLASDMQNTALLTGQYPDNGYGYVAPNGKKYWFVAYATHWHWRSTWIPACLRLAQTYALTGDRQYARKAIVMLDRIASTYPAMDYRTQSRDSLMGSQRPGKIVNAGWEYINLRDLSIAYDLVFETLVGNNPIQLPWRTALDIRKNIEANLIEESFDAYASYDIDGTYGAHQNALMRATIVRDAPQAETLMNQLVFEATSASPTYGGFNYAFSNIIYKDGFPIISSPNYNAYWVANFAAIADVSPLLGFNLFDQERMPRIFRAPIDLICAGSFTPNIGDSGSIYTEEMLPPKEAYETAYRIQPSPEFAWAFRQTGGLEGNPYSRFDDLLLDNIDTAANQDADLFNPIKPSRILDGFGVAILNNASDSVAVSMNYGIQGSHAHKDRLSIELFAHGSRVSPDLGYPDFTNASTPGRFAWTANTISHNAVAVNGGPQDGINPGVVRRFHRGTDVQVLEIDGGTSYAVTNKYRRTLVMVEVGNDAYVVDVFRVAGGANHVLSLHGAEGTFALTGATLSAVNSTGTLAGPTVGIGMNNGIPPGPPNYNTFASGYSFFYNWQNVIPTDVVTAQWSHTDGSMLRAHIGANTGQELVVADARVSPLLKIPAILKYTLLRRMADANGTTFVTVWELANTPIISGPVVISGEGSLGVGADRNVVLRVPRGSSTDTIAVANEPGTNYTLETGITSNAAVAVLGRTGTTWGRVFAAGGSHLTGSQTVNVPATLSGPIGTVNYLTKTITASTADSTVNPATLVGKTVRIFNSLHSSVYTISAASRSGTVLTLALEGSEVFTGRIKISGALIPEKQILSQTSTPFSFATCGMYMVTANLYAERIQFSNTYQRYTLNSNANMAPFTAALANGEDLWIADFGVGDTIEIERFVQSGV